MDKKSFALFKEIRKCTECVPHLPLGPNPVFQANKNAKIIIIGQAPGKKVHESSIPWDDPSGKNLRKWMGVDEDVFYGEQIALMPMGFCYPGKGKSGDLPPRKECAPKWHELLLNQMPDIELWILIGMYAQAYYLKEQAKGSLTETVRSYEDYGTNIIPIPHPSPRNRFWLAKNPWFETELVPNLQKRVKDLIPSFN